MIFYIMYMSLLPQQASAFFFVVLLLLFSCSVLRLPECCLLSTSLVLLSSHSLQRIVCLFVCLFVRRRNECHFSRSGRPREKISCFCGPCITQETSKRIVLSRVQPGRSLQWLQPCWCRRSYTSSCLFVCLFVRNLIAGIVPIGATHPDAKYS